MSIKTLSRREFLKTASLFSVGALSSLASIPVNVGNRRPNIVVILFDAMSALNLSLYGYSRETSPSLSKFADSCTVYNAHYSGSNFTSSGTASVLTGMLPWKHRAITQGSLISREMTPYNFYSLLGSEYNRLAFSQNFWPDRLIGQFYNDVDDFLPQTKYSMRGDTLVQSWLGKDRSLASIAFDNFLFPAQTDELGSALLGYIYKSRVAYTFEAQKFQQGYPLGTPEVEGYFLYQNEVVMQGVLSEIINLHNKYEPYFAYFHMFSPHAPYRPSNKFLQLFDDAEYKFPNKSAVKEFASLFNDTPVDMLEKRKLYDQQIAQLDAEIGKVMTRLDQDGILDDSYIIITSDHGEMFERGYVGHGGLMMYEPVVRSPLLIHAPNQRQRKDVYTPTSSTDLLPTILSIAGVQIPSQLEGRILPGFGGDEDQNRPIFSIFAWENSAFTPLRKAVFAMRKNNYKLIVYLGYIAAGENVYELFDLGEDPEELVNLVEKKPAILNFMKQEFFDHLSFSNANYVPR